MRRRCAGPLLFAILLFAGCGARTPLERTLRSAPIDSTVSRACVMFESCGGETGLLRPSEGQGVSKCVARTASIQAFVTGVVVTGLFQLTRTQCLATAAECDAVDTCIYGSAIACFSPPANAFCQSNYAIHCLGPGLQSSDDCSSPGTFRDAAATCMKSGTGDTVCAFGPCASNQSATCDGNTALSCSGGLLSRWTCPSGARCVAAAPDTAGHVFGECIGAGPACAASRCEGTDLVSCYGGHEFRLSCASQTIPSVCVIRSSGDGACGPSPDLACSPTDYLDHCDGTKLIYCDGAPRTIDCKDLGFKTCAEVGGWMGCK